MELLRTLTLIYAGILVVALAVSLTLILIYLRRIASKLGDIRSRLSIVAQRTEPFEAHFEAMDAGVARAEEGAINVSLHAASVANTLRDRRTISDTSRG